MITAQHGADHTPGVVVGLGAFLGHVYPEPVEGVEHLDGEDHLPADHVFLADRNAVGRLIPRPFPTQVVADRGVEEANLLRGRYEPAPRLERVRLHEVDGELSGLSHAP